MNELDGKVAILTGGGAAVGRAASVACAVAGARGLVADLRCDAVEEETAAL